MSWDRASQSPFGLTDAVPRIDPSEYKQRRQRLAASLAKQGLDGAVIWSRGGTATDRAGYGIYLANYYSPFFAGLEDFRPHWAGRGFSAVVLMSDGRASLVKDMNLFDASEVARGIDNVVQAFNIPRGVADALRKFGAAKGKIGTIGSEIVPLALFKQLQEELPGAVWDIVDDLLIDQMLIKSESELKSLRYANSMAMQVSDMVFEAAERKGVTEQDLNILTQRELAKRGCALSWMRPNSLRVIEPGELYTQAIIGWCGGYFFDLGRGRVVQGRATNTQKEFLDMLAEFVRRQCEALKPGITFGEASRVSSKYFIEELREFTLDEYENGLLGSNACYGHGLGLKFGKPFLREDETVVIQPGIYLQVEVVYGREATGMTEAEVAVEITSEGGRLLSQL